MCNVQYFLLSFDQIRTEQWGKSTKTFRGCKELPTNYLVPRMLMVALYALTMDYIQTVM